MLTFSAPARATKQWPHEFGPKDPLADVLGWCVVAAGLVVGALLFAYVVRRSRGMRWFSRSVVITFGFGGALVVWVGGFASAFVSFFFKC